MKRSSALLVLCLSLTAWPLAHAAPAQTVKLGLLTTLSGPVASIGKEQEMGVEVALEALGGKLGGIPVQMFVEDSRMQPDTAIQAAAKMVDQDKVDFLIGGVQSHQLLAILKPVSEKGTVILSAIAGPSELAGKGCSDSLFVTSWENNSPSEAVGQAMNQAGKKKAFFVAQNYVTGREHVAGAKTTFAGEVSGEAFVDRNVNDFASEISRIRAAKPDAVYVFMPGAQGVAFMKQYASSGLSKTAPLFSGSWLSDELSFKALGSVSTAPQLVGNWFSGLDNPENQKFVKAFREKYGRAPVFYAALAYDTMMLLNAAVASVRGDLSDKDKLKQAIRTAKFDSVRGPFAFNNNQFPVQNMYSAAVVKSGDTYAHEVSGTIFEKHADRFASLCPMK